MKAIPIFLYKVVNAFVSGLQSKIVVVANTFFEMVSRGRCWNKTVSNDSLVILPFCSIVFFLLSCVYMKTKQAKSNHFLFLNSKHGVVNLQKFLLPGHFGRPDHWKHRASTTQRVLLRLLRFAMSPFVFIWLLAWMI